MSNVWYKALMAEPPVVYGLRLRPFSICHRITLSEFESPFLFDGPITLEDVYRCIMVCSRTRLELRRDLFMIMTPMAFLLWSIRWFVVSKKTPIAIEKIRRYIADFSDVPKHSLPERRGDGWRELKAPSEYILHKSLCDRGYHPEEAWDVSCAMARCLYDVDEEKDNGDRTLLSQNQIAEDEIHAAAMREEKSGNKDEAKRLYAIEEKMIAARKNNIQ